MQGQRGRFWDVTSNLECLIFWQLKTLQFKTSDFSESIEPLPSEKEP